MNSRYLIEAGLFCGGLLLGVLCTRSHYKSYYQKIADEEIESVKRKYSEDSKKAIESVNEELEKYKADRRVLKANLSEAYRELGVAQADDIIAAQGYVVTDEDTLDAVKVEPLEDDTKKNVEGWNRRENLPWYEEQRQLEEDMKKSLGPASRILLGSPDCPDDEDYHNEDGALLTGDELEVQQIKNLNSRARSGPKIEIITAESFGDLYTEGYACESLLYYVEDRVLACEESDMDGHPEIIDDKYAAVGNALNEFYDDLRPEEPIYVRNNGRSVDYEIIKVCASYAESEGPSSED